MRCGVSLRRGVVILLLTLCGSTSLITGINQEMLPVLAETAMRIFRGKRLSLIVTPYCAASSDFGAGG